MTTINTLALCFVLGWQGGTVHQVADALQVTTGDIIDADYEAMGALFRLAQTERRLREGDLLAALRGLLGDQPDIGSVANSPGQCAHCGRDYDADDDRLLYCPADDCAGHKARVAIAKARGAA